MQCHYQVANLIWPDTLTFLQFCFCGCGYLGSLKQCLIRGLLHAPEWQRAVCFHQCPLAPPLSGARALFEVAMFISSARASRNWLGATYGDSYHHQDGPITSVHTTPKAKLIQTQEI